MEKILKKIIFIFLGLPFLGYSNTPIKIVEGFSPLYVGAFLEVHEDFEDTLNLEEALLFDKWETQSKTKFKTHPWVARLWIRFKVINQTNKTQDLSLVLENPLLDEVQFFSVDKQQLVDSSLSIGNDFPFNQRAIKHRFPIYDFQLAPGQELTIYSSIKEKGKHTYIHLKMYSREQLIPALQLDVVYKILLLSPVIFLTVISCLFIFYETKIYTISYALAFVLALLFLLGLEGLGFHYLWPNNLFLQKTFLISYPLYHIFVSITLLSFFKINIKTKTAQLLYLVIGIQLIFLFYIVINPIPSSISKSIEIILVYTSLLSNFLISISCLTFYLSSKMKPILKAFWLSLLHLSINLFITFTWLGGLPLQQYFSIFEVTAIFFGLQSILTYLLIIVYYYRRNFDYKRVESQLSAKQNEALQNLLTGQEIERKRISRELHDGLSIRMLQVKQGLDKIKETIKNDRIPIIIKEVNEVYQDIRNLSHTLNPTVLQEFGLEKAINDLIFNIEAINLDLDIQLSYPQNFNPKKEQETHFYYIIQELLNNTLKYANSNYVYIEIKMMRDRIFLYYFDNGIGYDPNNLDYSGIGIQNIKSRVALMEGTFKIIARKPKGMEHHIYVSY